MARKERLDKLLVERGLVASREKGRKLILAGEVWVDRWPAVKVGSLVDPAAVIRLKEKSSRYAGRGGDKLEGALRSFGISAAGRAAVDVGASTGGFTDCLLVHGARQVYAVDVGYGQLDWRLRRDPRVTVIERTNIRHLKPEAIPEPADLATIDVSFISLRLVLPAVIGLLAARADIVALIKPQFEVGKGKVGKGGVVRSSEEHSRVIEEIKEFALGLDLSVAGVVESSLVGPKGNREFFIHLAKSFES
jgi:23S rRNA (cytidine1920-2'-O)/16S rRNA (cytidine1409-2'-O)-methyltransferase